MSKSLKGKVAFVTGAASGIGRATALLLAKENAKVMVTDINESEGNKTTQMINESGGYAKFFRLDVTQITDVQAICQTILESEGQIDLAVNNAGIGDIVSPIHQINQSTWERMLAVCLSGVFYCMQECLKQMLTKGYGRIVNVSSLAGLNGVAGGAHYSAAKHAVIGLTKSAAIEYGSKNIRVNAVCPGFIQTAMYDSVPKHIQDFSTQYRVPMKRIGTADEVAKTILWLLSDDSSYVNGDTILLDGGFKAG